MESRRCEFCRKHPMLSCRFCLQFPGNLVTIKTGKSEQTEYNGEKTMHHREELKQEIEKKRKELSEMIDRQADAETLYRLSVELDQLIAQYMGH